MRTGTLTAHRMTANQMGAKVAELLEDPNMARYSATRILEGLNDAIADWCIRTRCVYDAVDVQFVDGTRDYNVKTVIDAGGNRELGVIERIGIYDGTTQDWPYEFLKGAGLFELDKFGLSGYGDGPAQAWYTDLGDFHEISILPVPDDDYDAGPPKDNGAYVLYAGIPALMTYSAPNFGGLDELLPTLAQLPICFGAAGMILEYGQGDELTRAQEHLAVFEKGIQDCIQGAALAATDYGEVEPI
jgi:hypothetical protein